jgi:cell division septation protein DedD
MAQLPAPAPVEPARAMVVPPEPPRLAYNPPPAQPRSRFALIPTAQAAEPVPFRRAAGEAGQWAIQVGAYSNQNQAHAALGAAKGRAHAELAVAHPYVGMVHQARGTLWRARLTGLSRESAVQACEKLTRGRTSCIVLSPEAQS